MDVFRLRWLNIVLFLALLMQVIPPLGGAAAPYKEDDVRGIENAPTSCVEVSGIIGTDTTWSAADSPYCATGNILVEQDVILTVEPGVTVRFGPTRTLQVDGGLVALGTVTQSITFTSAYTQPQPGDWGGILFTATTIDAVFDGQGAYIAGSGLRYVILEYGGTDHLYVLSGSGNVSDKATIYVEHSTIRHNASGGILLTGEGSYVAHNTITNNTAAYCGAINNAARGSLIYENLITDNTGGWSGGICNSADDVIIRKNTIINNVGNTGGGIRQEYADNTIVSENVIRNNTATYGGGGLYSNSTNTQITHNMIQNNTAPYGGGIHYGDSGQLMFNTIVSNTSSTNAGGIYLNGAYESVIWKNTLQFNQGYALYNGHPSTSPHVDARYNYWGTSDDATIQTLIYDWFDDGTKSIVDYAPILTAPYTSLQSVSLTGPITGVLNTAQAFTATVMPITTTLPITYTWQATGQTPITHTGATTSTVAFTWSISGTKIISVTATNGGGTAIATHAIAILVTVQPPSVPGVIYVDADAPGSIHDGSSWATAYTTVQSALTVAVYSDEIWVAEGVYYPDEGAGQTNNIRESTFTLKEGVALYGGFVGTETIRGQRDWTAHPTILSGDIDANDWNTDTNQIAETWNDIVGANAYHVVTSSYVTETARIDGFVITAGNAVAAGNFPHEVGGGIYNSGDGSPTLVNIIFSGNQAIDGGGIFNTEGNSILNNVIFRGNSALLGDGGGISNVLGNCSLTDVTFDNNQAAYFGGGIANFDTLSLTNVTFDNNQARDGGGIYDNGNHSVLINVAFNDNYATGYGGGIYNDSGNPILINSVFNANDANYGGGLANSSSSPVLTNATFNGNQANQGGGIFNDSYSTPELINSILWGNTASTGAQIYNDGTSIATVTYSDVENGYTGNGNLNVNPLFVDASNNDLRLQTDSPAIDAGNSTVVTVTTDLDGNPRVVGSTVDMGAYEVQMQITGTYQVYHPEFLADFYGYDATIHLHNPNPMPATAVLSFTNGPAFIRTLVAGETLIIPSASLPGLAGVNGYTGALLVESDQLLDSAVHLSGANNVFAYSGLTHDTLYPPSPYPTPTAYMLHFAPLYMDSPVNSNLVLFNYGANSAVYNVQFYDLAGVSIASATGTIGAGGRDSLNLQTVSNLPTGFIGWAVLSSDQPLAALSSHIDGSAMEMRPPLATAQTVYQPRVFKAYDEGAGPCTSHLLIANTESTSAQATLDLLDSGGAVAHSSVLNLPSYGATLVDMSTLLTTLADGTVWSARAVGNTELVLGETTFCTGADSTAAYYAGAGTSVPVPLLSTTVTTRTILSLQNQVTVANPITVTNYAPNGSVVYQQTATLAAAGFARYDQQQLTLLPTNFVGSAIVTAKYPVGAWVDITKAQNPLSLPSHLITLLAFDNNLSPYIPIIIERVRQGTAANPDVIATLLVDGAADGDTHVLEIAGGIITQTNTISFTGELDTANPDVLANFLTWARTRHPQHREVLALTGHGAGLSPEIHTQSGAFALLSTLPSLPRGHDFTPVDITSGTYLSTPELGRALASATDNGTNPFAIIFFDQCFMGNFDTLYEVRAAAEVFIASPNYAWGAFASDGYIGTMLPTASTEDIAQGMVDAYQAALDETHPNSMFWVRGADIQTIADALNDLGDTLRVGLGEQGFEARVLASVMQSKFVDTTLCEGDLELCPPDEMMDLRSFASALQAEFEIGTATYIAAGEVLSTLVAVHSKSISGQPWIKPDVTWDMADLGLTIIAPLTQTLTATPDVIWRGTLYTNALTLDAVWSPQPTRTVTIATPWASAVDGRWDDFIAAWYAQEGAVPAPLRATVGQWCYVMPPALVMTGTGSLTLALTAQANLDNVQLSWTTITTATNYALYMQPPQGATWELLTVTTAVSYQHAALASGHYAYFVAARDNHSDMIGQSDEVAVEVGITSIVPNFGLNNVPTMLYIHGLGFVSPLSVTLGSTVLEDVVVVNPELIRAVVPAGLTPSVYNVTVQTAAAQNVAYAAYTVVDAGVVDDLLSTTEWLWTDPATLRVGQIGSSIGLIVQRLGGKFNIGEIEVEFRLGGPQGTVLGRALTNLLPPDSIESSGPVVWEAQSAGTYEVCAIIDPDNAVAESNEANNVICRDVTVLPPAIDTVPPVVDRFVIEDDASSTSSLTVTLDVTATDYPIPGASGMGYCKFIEFEYILGAQRWVPIQRSDWKSYASAHEDYAWTLLPTFGLRYLQSWCSDNVGNISLEPGVDIINLLPATQEGHVDQNGVVFYRLYLGQGESLSARLTPINGDPDLYVWSPNGNLWHSNQQAGVEDVVAFDAPVTGTYQIEVHGFTAADYRLTFDVQNRQAQRAVISSPNDKPLPPAPTVPLDEWPLYFETTSPVLVESQDNGGALSSGYSQDAVPGSSVIYTHTVMNTGATTDTILLQASNSAAWTWTLRHETVYPDGTALLPLQLGAQMTSTVVLSLTVPTAAISGTVNTTTITATSTNDPSKSTVIFDLTRVIEADIYTSIFLPLVLRSQP